MEPTQERSQGKMRMLTSKHLSHPQDTAFPHTTFPSVPAQTALKAGSASK